MSGCLEYKRSISRMLKLIWVLIITNISNKRNIGIVPKIIPEAKPKVSIQLSAISKAIILTPNMLPSWPDITMKQIASPLAWNKTSFMNNYIRNTGLAITEYWLDTNRRWPHSAREYWFPPTSKRRTDIGWPMEGARIAASLHLRRTPSGEKLMRNWNRIGKLHIISLTYP